MKPRSIALLLAPIPPIPENDVWLENYVCVMLT